MNINRAPLQKNGIFVYTIFAKIGLKIGRGPLCITAFMSP